MTGWPTPEPGLIVRYAYLWRREQQAGRGEGSKDRPCAIVVALAGNEGEQPRGVVLAIAHTPPLVPADGVELPAATKRRLALDGERSWVIVAEVNVFLWPGPDLRVLPDQGPESSAYGVLPPAVFRVVRDRFIARLQERRAVVVPRSE